jgi:hypothetical protein
MTFWLYLRWSFEFLYEPPFAYGTLLLVLNAVASGVCQKPFGKPIWKQIYSIIIVQFLFFPTTLAVAALGYVDWTENPFPEPNYWGLRVEDAFAIGSFVLGIYWVWRMKGLRWFAASCAIFQLWLLSAAQFIAAMALKGKWL